MPSKTQSAATNGAPSLATSEPATKKQKLLPTPSTSQSSQSSFAEVLAKIQLESQESAESEGGADAWGRPPLRPIVASRDSIVFQQVDIEDSYDSSHAGARIRICGVTQGGHSVLASVTDFMPYFFVPAPRGFRNEDVDAFVNELNTSVGGVISIELVNKRSLWGYLGSEFAVFMRVTVTQPRNVPRVRGVFESGEVSFRGLFSGPVTTFESNIPYTLRFMIDTKVVGMNWIEIPAGKYTLLKGKEKKSSCQIELLVRADGTSSYLTRRRVIGQRSLHYASSVSISSARVGKECSLRHLLILSSK